MLPTAPHRPCKPFTSGLLLALLVFQCAGWLVAWHVARHEACWTMRREIFAPETALRHVTLLAAELPRLRVDRHEIRFEGGLYDIRAQVVQGDSVRLTLYHDIREERLYEVLGSLLQPEPSSSAPHSPLRAWWAQWFGANYLLPESPAPPRLLEKPRATHFFPFLLPVAQEAPECSSPPPERA